MKILMLILFLSVPVYAEERHDWKGEVSEVGEYGTIIFRVEGKIEINSLFDKSAPAYIFRKDGTRFKAVVEGNNDYGRTIVQKAFEIRTWKRSKVEAKVICVGTYTSTVKKEKFLVFAIVKDFNRR